ncbi:hypothetical protein ABIQ69_15505 [Agromyces sp. G08B096]|uniref:Uncharacterized protein n=1 Tax=Agromyces sp. G08B096 TaxID=3156399 RepID=A0AAU7W5W1_9MICO
MTRCTSKFTAAVPAIQCVLESGHAGLHSTGFEREHVRPVAHRRRTFRDTAAAQVLTIAGLTVLAIGMAAVAAWLMTGGVR